MDTLDVPHTRLLTITPNGRLIELRRKWQQATPEQIQAKAQQMADDYQWPLATAEQVLRSCMSAEGRE